MKNLNAKMEKIGHLRAAVVHAFRTEIARHDSRSKNKGTRKFLDDYNFGSLYPELYLQLGKISRSTLYAWNLAFREEGLSGVIPRYGSRRRAEITEVEKKILLHLVLIQSRLPIGLTVRWAKFLLKEKGLESPSRMATMRRWLADFRTRSRKNAWLLLRHNERALRSLLAASEEELNENGKGNE